MAITKPPIFTSIEEAEVSFPRPVSEETVRKMIQNANMLAELAKIGSIICIQVNAQGVTAPSTDIFQIADGGQITHPISPLTPISPATAFTPDMKERFIRGAFTQLSNPASSVPETVNLNHSHGVGQVCGPIVGEEGDERHGYENGCHSHGMSSDLNSAEPLDPAHIQVAMYLKIN